MVRPAPGTGLLNATYLPFRAVAKPPRGRTPVDCALLNQSVAGVISPEALTKGGKQPALPLESQEETIMATGQTWHNAYAPTLQGVKDAVRMAMEFAGIRLDTPYKLNIGPNKKGTGYAAGWTFDTDKIEIFISDKAYVAPTPADTPAQDVNPGTEPF